MPLFNKLEPIGYLFSNKGLKKKEIGKYKDKSELLQTLKLPSIFHLFFTLILHLLILLLFNKLEPKD
jgi:hypothetical protein